MKTKKYFILAGSVSYFSNSRNARRHLLENDAICCYVFANTEDAPLVSMAQIKENVVLVGAVKGART